MKIKDDVLDKWESGEWTIYDIAEHYCTPVEDPFSYELH
jgi:hypothetical protein